MIILPLILAAGSFLSWPDPRNPGLTVTVYSDYPMADPVLSPRQQIADRIFQERPMLDRMPATRSGNIYDEVAERYPIREVVPRNMRQTMSTEEALALETYQTDQLAKETQIKGQMLNQRIAQRNLDYDTKIMNQTEAAMQRIGQIDPRSSDFDAQTAALFEEFPLAQQNPAFNGMVGRLAQTRNQEAQNQEILNRSLQQHTLNQVARGDAQDLAMDNNAAQLGAGAYRVYQDELEKTGGDRQAAYAVAVTRAAQDDAAVKRQQELSAPITRADYLGYTRRMDSLLGTENLRKSPEELSSQDRAEYDMLRGFINRYAEQQAQSQQGYQSYRPQATTTSQPQTPASTSAPAPQPQATPPTKALPIQSLFPKSSTQQSGSGS